jgi:hypothetical protein
MTFLYENQKSMKNEISALVLLGQIKMQKKRQCYQFQLFLAILGMVQQANAQTVAYMLGYESGLSDGKRG